MIREMSAARLELVRAVGAKWRHRHQNADNQRQHSCHYLCEKFNKSESLYYSLHSTRQQHNLQKMVFWWLWKISSFSGTTLFDNLPRLGYSGLFARESFNEAVSYLIALVERTRLGLSSFLLSDWQWECSFSRRSKLSNWFCKHLIWFSSILIVAFKKSLEQDFSIGRLSINKRMKLYMKISIKITKTKTHNIIIFKSRIGTFLV